MWNFYISSWILSVVYKIPYLQTQFETSRGSKTADLLGFHVKRYSRTQGCGSGSSCFSQCGSRPASGSGSSFTKLRCYRYPVPETWRKKTKPIGLLLPFCMDFFWLIKSLSPVFRFLTCIFLRFIFTVIFHSWILIQEQNWMCFHADPILQPWPYSSSRKHRNIRILKKNLLSVI